MYLEEWLSCSSILKNFAERLSEEAEAAAGKPTGPGDAIWSSSGSAPGQQNSAWINRLTVVPNIPAQEPNKIEL